MKCFQWNERYLPQSLQESLHRPQGFLQGREKNPDCYLRMLLQIDSGN